MNDPIDRQAALDAVHKSILDFFDICDNDEESPMTYKDEQLLEVNKAITLRIKQLPSVEAEPVRHGHWIIPRFGADAKCSVCGYYFNDAYDMENEDNYCRHCGADMRGEVHEDIPMEYYENGGI